MVTTLDKILAKHGQTIKDDCNTCKCLFGKLQCTDLVCKKSCKVGDGKFGIFHSKVHKN